MAPAIPPKSSSSDLRHLLLRSLAPQGPKSPDTSIASFLTLVLTTALSFSGRALKTTLIHGRTHPPPVFLTRESSISPHPAGLTKRQAQILAIPTTYRGLNDGPAPAALVGIVLGAVLGFILILYVILSIFRFGPWNRRVEEDVVVTHRHRSHHSRSRSRPMTERSRSRRREETVVVEERHQRREPESVVVEEEDEDVVEVIEEESSVASPPRRKPSGRSGFRTVDPAEFAGGRAPVRKLGRRS